MILVLVGCCSLLIDDKTIAESGIARISDGELQPISSGIDFQVFELLWHLNLALNSGLCTLE